MNDEPEGDEPPQGRFAYFHAYSERRVRLRELPAWRRRWYREVVEHWLADSELTPSTQRLLPVPLTMMERLLLKLRLNRRVEERVMRRVAEITPLQFELRSWQRHAVFLGFRQPKP